MKINVIIKLVNVFVLMVLRELIVLNVNLVITIFPIVDDVIVIHQELKENLVELI